MIINEIKDVLPKELSILVSNDNVSVADGLKYCGNVRDFEKYLDSFYYDIEFKSQEIEDAYDRGDIPFFTIKVHALKTSARMIGATRLSELSSDMEQAGKNGDIQFIDANQAELLAIFRSYTGVLEDYISAKNSKEKMPISEQELDEAFSALQEIVPTMDYDGVEMILDELDNYCLPDYEQQQAIQMRKLLRNLEWDEMISLVNEGQSTMVS